MNVTHPRNIIIIKPRPEFFAIFGQRSRHYLHPASTVIDLPYRILDKSGCLRGLTGSAVGHIYSTGFKPRPGYTRKLFHLSLRLITVAGLSAHLAYFVHKSGRQAVTHYIFCLINRFTLHYFHALARIACTHLHPKIDMRT